MNPWTRWLRFNVVGLGGMALQVAVLAALHRMFPAHLTLETAVAVECAVLHNFVWHVHSTWRDRECGSSWPLRLARFQLSNGMVSVVGNVALMRVLVTAARVPLLPAQLVSIAVCSLVNFGLGDRFVFAAEAG